VTLFSYLLYGINVVQVFYYYVSYNDGFAVKGLVAFLFIVDTVQKIMVSMGLWHYLIAQFGDIVGLGIVNIPFLVHVFFTSLCSTVVQAFFVWRIYLFSGRKWIFIVIFAPFVLVQPAASIPYILKAVQNGQVANLHNLSLYAYLINVTAAAVDIAIAIIMIILLMMGRTGLYKNTDRMFVRLILTSVNTGLWTAVTGILVVALLLAQPENLIWTSPYVALSSLYCNTMLANLNAREFIRTGVPTAAYTLSSSRGIESSQVPMNRYRSTRKSGPTLDVSVATTTLQEMSPAESKIGWQTTSDMVKIPYGKDDYDHIGRGV